MKANDYGWQCDSCRGWYANAITTCPVCKKADKTILRANPMLDMGEAIKVRKTRVCGTKKGMSETERRFDHWIFGGIGLYERITLNFANGHKYTPDFLAYDEQCVKPIILYEVKGAYKLPSHQRARLAFDQAAIEFPYFDFQWWAQKGKEFIRER